MTTTCERPRCHRPATVTVRSNAWPRPWLLHVCAIHASPYTGTDSRPGVYVTTEEHQ